jgi:hypothetical protein
MKADFSIPFIEPVFKGNRFTSDQPHLPVQAFPELIAYDAIIRATAKELYFSAHTDRTRLPKGFQERFKLILTDIQPGSVVSVLSRDFESEHKEEDEFDRARDLLNEFISSVKDQKPFDKFPKKVIYLFEDLGKTLQHGDTIELRIPGKNISTTYSKETRSRILSISKKPYLDVCYLTGSISGFDAEKRKLFIVLEDGQPIEGPLDPSFDALLRDIAPKYKKKDIAVTLIGLARYNPDGSVVEIKKLQHLVVYQEGIPEFFPNLRTQLGGLRDLKDGWLNGEGQSFQQSDVDMVQQWLETLLKTGDIPAPFIYPADNNVIECEWSFGFWEISFSFLLPLKAVVLHAAHVNSQEIREDRLILQDQETIEKAQRFLKTALHQIHE